eukprot:SAG31_NODE_840_length_11596_cov_3.056623_2_plen_142_part_00
MTPMSTQCLSSDTDWISLHAGGYAVNYWRRGSGTMEKQGKDGADLTQIALHEYTAGHYRCSVSTPATLMMADSQDLTATTFIESIESTDGHDDEPFMKEGTRVLVAGLGKGSITSFRHHMIGANEYTVQVVQSISIIAVLS